MARAEFSCRKGDDVALADALLKAVANPEALPEIARRGADSVREKFERSAQTQKLEDYYFEAMD